MWDEEDTVSESRFVVASGEEEERMDGISRCELLYRYK